MAPKTKDKVASKTASKTAAKKPSQPVAGAGMINAKKLDRRRARTASDDEVFGDCWQKKRDGCAKRGGICNLGFRCANFWICTCTGPTIFIITMAFSFTMQVTCGIGSFLFCDDVLLEVTGAILLFQIAVVLILSILAVVWMCQNPDSIATPPTAKESAARKKQAEQDALLKRALEQASKGSSAAAKKKGGKGE